MGINRRVKSKDEFLKGGQDRFRYRNTEVKEPTRYKGYEERKQEKRENNRSIVFWNVADLERQDRDF